MIPGAWAVAWMTAANLNPWHCFAWSRAEQFLRFTGQWK